ncbi:four-carbon acid sugar kinase family protein [Peribacillus frigoritolerans]|uniref:four-carbon acid sugar kinase family protein n=1 Tax=Peribacillus frigoritolerans TaxID=450367 RepID=UPI00192652B8|nr:four-carbon acid sugar kinase family protein [Bacillus sp. RHFB]MEE3950872.1 four-carbon acid sugar kinase family protein [Peribacillus frigoritolerans]
MIRVFIIADDFTGALDTGVQFSNYGVNTVVTSDLEFEFGETTDQIEVLVFNTETRYLNKCEAYEVIKKIALKAKEENIQYIFKKVDSALRGNVASELRALSDVFEGVSIPFIPAYPEQNRFSCEGILHIDSIPVSESAFGQDPYEPVIESHIPSLLLKETDLKTYITKKYEIPPKEERILLIESHSDEEMLSQGNELLMNDALNITVGCAGFAKALANIIYKKRDTTQNDIKLPLLIVCGSVNPVTKKQIVFAEVNGFERISLTMEQLWDKQYWDTVKGQENINQYLKAEQPLMFETFGNVSTDKVNQLSDQRNEARFRIGQSLGYLVKNLMSNGIKRTLLFTGGDTLYQSMRVLGITEIKPLKELFPGIVLGSIDFKNEKHYVITKSGGFGNEDLFIKLNELISDEGDVYYVKSI